MRLSSISAKTAIMIPTHNPAYWARLTKGMNFDVEDRGFVKSNRIIWAGLKRKQPYPAGLSVRGSEDKREL